MVIEFTGRQVEIAPAVRAQAERKIGKLAKVLPGITHVRVVLGAEKRRHRAEVTVHSPLADLVANARGGRSRHGPGVGVRQADRAGEAGQDAEARGPAAQDGARRRAPPAPAARPPAEAPGDGRPRVIRSRRFVAKPMTLDEAALLVGGNGDGVLVFRDTDTRRIACSSGAGTATSASSNPKRDRVKRRPRPRPPAWRRPGGRPPPGHGAPADRRGEVRDGPSVPVRALLEAGPEALQLKLAAGRGGLDHQITLARVQRPGLALTGYTDYIRYGRVQIMGGSELSFLGRLPPARRAAAIARLARCRISCFIVTKGQRPPAELLAEAEARGIPVLVTRAESTPFIKALSAFLEERLALRLHLHSVLLDVFGLGVLIVGESGIGKSECALDLIDRGHRLIADDVAEIKRIGDSPDRRLAGPDALPHGAARPRGAQHQGPVRRVVGADVAARGAGGEPRALGGGAGVRPARPPGRALHDPRHRAAAGAHAGGPGPEHRHPGGGGRAQPAAQGPRVRRGPPVRGARGRDDRGRRALRRRRLAAGRARRARAPARGDEEAPPHRPPRRGAPGAGPPGAAADPHHHRPLRLGEDARGAGPRRHRLVLRRQPAHRAHPAVRRPHPRLRGAAAVGAGGRHARARLPEAVPPRLPRDQGQGDLGQPHVPGERGEGAAAPLQRDPAPAPAGHQPARDRGDPGGEGGPAADPQDGGP